MLEIYSYIQQEKFLSLASSKPAPKRKCIGVPFFF
jgi:hypothetical protein